MCCQHHIHTRTHTFTRVYVSIYDAVQSLAAAVLEFVYILYYIWEYFNSVCCVYASRREREAHARATQ
jgi:hypothetical protein